MFSCLRIWWLIATKILCFTVFAATIMPFILEAFEMKLAQASIQIPTQLDKNDRQEALRILGFGTSSKILSDPFPLGGYIGLEAGIAIENLPTYDLSRLGNQLSAPQREVTYRKFSIGKGLYNNLDFFLQFTPYNQQEALSQYGGLLRWGFFQATFLPLSASILVHVSSANINNQISVRTQGVDLVGGINVSQVALFAGIGHLSSEGRFLGGATNITDTHQTETESVRGTHTLLGASVRVSRLLIALQIDRYTVPVFSAKLGVLF